MPTSMQLTKKNFKGFTLIELIITLSLTVILSLIALPSLLSFIQSQRVLAEINNLLSDIQFARSEALKEGQMVGICASSNGTTCNTTTWQSGWIVYSAGATPNFVSGTSIVLRVQPAFSSTDQFTLSPAGLSALTFNEDGFTQGLASTAGVLFTLKNTGTSNSTATRCLWIDIMGRTYLQRSGDALAANGQVTACS